MRITKMPTGFSGRNIRTVRSKDCSQSGLKRMRGDDTAYLLPDIESGGIVYSYGNTRVYDEQEGKTGSLGIDFYLVCLRCPIFLNLKQSKAT